MVFMYGKEGKYSVSRKHFIFLVILSFNFSYCGGIIIGAFMCIFLVHDPTSLLALTFFTVYK